MKVTEPLSGDRFSASSDFELKLVVIWLVGTVRVLTNVPEVVI